MSTRFDFRFYEADGITPRTLDPEAAEIVRAALESLTRAVAREVGIANYSTVTIEQEASDAHPR